MSAEEYGRRLLKEVEVVSMDEILRDLRNSQDEQFGPAQELGILGIDRLLRSTLNVRDAAPKPYDAAGDTLLRLNNARTSKAAIELTSLSPGAGKTHLLYLIAGLAVLPLAKTAGQPHGKNSAVVVFDTDDRFDIDRLAATLRNYLKYSHLQPAPSEGPRKSPESDGTEEMKPAIQDESIEDSRNPESESSSRGHLDELVYDCLRHVHVFRPQSIQSLLTTLESLETYLLNVSGHYSGGRPVNTVILDSASTFYWQHRAEEDVARLRKIEGVRGEVTTTLPPLYAQVLRVLKETQHRLDCHVIYTTHSNPPFKDVSASFGRPADHGARAPNPRPLLPATWFAYPTLRVLVQRARVSRFAVSMSVQEAWADRDMRWEAARKGQFTASTIGTDGSERDIFKFTIDAHGMLVGEEEETKEPAGLDQS